MLIAVFLEVFVFNMRFWESIRYQPTPLTITNVGEGLGIGEDGTYIFNGSDSSYFEIEGIDKPIKNLYISISAGKGSYLQRLTLEATDEGNYEYFEMPQRELVSTVERSKYIKMNTSGNVDKLRLNLDPQLLYGIDMSVYGSSKSSHTITIDEITANKQVPFFFEPIRLLLVLLVLILIYTLRYGSGIYGYVINLKSPNQRLVLVLVLAANILLANYIYLNNLYYFGLDRDVYTNLATSLLNGRFDLPMLNVSNRLKSLSNPYDLSMRNAFNVPYFWDYAYFNGKYYVYFGIVPCLIWFLPIKAIFNYNLPANLGMFHFTVAYIFVGFRFVYAVCKRLFKKISFATYILIAELFVFCSAMPYVMSRNDLYGIPTLAALIFSMLGIDLWLGSLDDDGVVKGRVKLCLGSLCMALVAGCRPQLVLGSFLALPLFYRAVFKNRSLVCFKGKGLVNTVLFALPYVVVAAFLMYYNYVRFGSVTDFGAMYNLTTNDMTKRGFKLDRIGYGLFAYLFQPLNVSARFPFLENCSLTTSYMGVTNAEMVRGGAFSLVPFLFISLALFTKNMRKSLKQKRLLTAAIMCNAFAIVIIIADINMAGIVFRYIYDGMWLFMLSAMAAYLTALERTTGELTLKMRYGFSLVWFYTMTVNILLVFMRYRHYSMDVTNPDMFYSIMYAIQFWM
jgi:hypothetical protein